jgi:hypothetical protein
VLNLLLLGGTAALLRRLTGLSWLRVLLVVFLAIVPLRTNFQFGQQHLLLFSLLAVAAWLDAVDRPFASGSALAVASALKLYPALFALYFVRKRSWRGLAGLVVTGAALGVLALWLFGLEPVRVYVEDILPRGLRAENNDPFSVSLNSPNALLRRMFVFEPELNVAPILDAPKVYAALSAIVQALILVPGLWFLTPGRGSGARERLEWGSFVALLLALSSGSATYHFCVLILATALIAGALFEEKRARLAWSIVLLHALVCFPLYRWAHDDPSSWRMLTSFPRLWAVMAYWGLTVWILARTREQAPRPGERLAFALVFVALVALGVAGNLRHVAGVDASYAARLTRQHWTLLATAPSVAGDEVYFARMDEGGSTIDRASETRGAYAVRGLRGMELFHPTVTDASRDGWAELSSATSKVVRFSRDSAEIAVPDLPVEVEDAEQPVISRDARWLAFLREDATGRAELHLLDREATAGRPREHAIVSAPRDVLDVDFLPDDRIVLAAMTGSRPRLYIGDGAGFVEVDTAGRPARYPAASPDGRSLAYGAEEQGRWRIRVRELTTGAEREVTAGDCNATAPAWLAGSKRIVYATDCGRGLGHTALSVLDLPP